METRNRSVRAARRPKTALATHQSSVTARPPRRQSARLNTEVETQKAPDVWVELPRQKRRRVMQDESPPPEVVPKTLRRTSSRTSIPTEKERVRRRTSEPKADEETGSTRKVARRAPKASSRSSEDRWKKLAKDLQHEEQSLKRSRDEFEAESQNARSELEKRDNILLQTARELKRLEKQLGKRAESLKKKEETVKKKEKTVRKKEETVKKKEEAVKKQEQETSDLAVSFTVSRVQEVLAEMEEQYTCALCFDIMACPYNLVPPQCGHSFCALCILKWFFSHLHDDCGGWHVQLECPLCRNALPFPSDAVPRNMLSCPFTPNRLADKVLTDLISSMRGPGSDAASTSSSKGKNKRKDVDAGQSMSAEWREGGSSKLDWQERNRRGRTEMNFVIGSWTKLTADDFRAVKRRLAA